MTGGAGYIGSHACKALAHAGFQPVSYDNFSRGHRDFVRWGPSEEGDICDATRLRAVIAKHQPDAVMHFAAFAYVGESVQKPDIYYANNVTGTQTLLREVATAGIDKLVLSSTCAVYGTPEVMPVLEDTAIAPASPYGESKVLMEQLAAEQVRSSGMRYLALRYFNAAGADPEGDTGERHDPETHLIPLALAAAAKRTQPLTVFGDDYDTPDGTCIRDYIHVADIASAHVQALSYLTEGGESHALNLGNGNGYSVRDVLGAVEQVTGHPVPHQIGPRREGDPPRVTADASKAAAVLGWTPSYPDLSDQIAHAWAWHQKDWA